jgi:hypothetical protein
VDGEKFEKVGEMVDSEVSRGENARRALGAGRCWKVSSLYSDIMSSTARGRAHPRKR